MHPGVQRKLFGFALLGAVAAATAGGLRISRQRRHTEFYQAFYAALEKAVAHYEGCVAATATAIRFSPSIESATVRAMLRERPPQASAHHREHPLVLDGNRHVSARGQLHRHHRHPPLQRRRSQPPFDLATVVKLIGFALGMQPSLWPITRVA